jgi:hypothetical protein
VETLLDHVTIIEQNAVLLNEKMNMEEPVNLEELFIEALNRAQISAS